MRLRFVAVLVAVAFVTTACADSGHDGAARVVDVVMVDVAFEPDVVDVEAGETIRFVFRNDGDVAHDAFIGDRDAQLEHAEDAGEGHHHGDDADAVTVGPGTTEDLVHTFEEPGTFEVGCHQPGHYEAGMVLTVRVR